MGLIYRESVRDSDAGHRHVGEGRARERFQMRGMMPNRTALQCKTTLRPSKPNTQAHSNVGFFLCVEVVRVWQGIAYQARYISS